MSTGFNHLPVNWVDGMKISRKHFVETQDFLIEQLMFSNSLKLTPYNYGILPGDSSLAMEVQCDFSKQISVEVSHCNAITPNGAIIAIQPFNRLKTSVHFDDISAKYSLSKSQPQTLCILISVHPFKHLPHGEPLPDENPPRHPYALSELRLDVLPLSHINPGQLGYNLLVGKIEYNNGELSYEREFIPPCTSVNSLPVIQRRYEAFRSQLDAIEIYCTRIIEKINLKGSKDTLPRCIGKLTEMILFHVADNKTHYRLIIPQSAPVFMCEVLLRLLQRIHTTLQCFSSNEREEVINYFVSWYPGSAISKGEILSRVTNTLQMPYDQFDLDGLLTEIKETFQMYIDILEAMAGLEYIGQVGKFKLGNVDISYPTQPQPRPESRPEKPAKPSGYNPSDITKK